MQDGFTGDEFVSEAEARRLYAQGDAAHDFDHVQRVVRLALHIAQAEGADVTVVRLAALLHDVPAAPTEPHDELGEAGAAGQRRAHHLDAARYAAQLLAGRGLGTERIANVVHSIEAHRFRDRSIAPQTLEAKCLYDADKLDSIGAIGVGRAFAYAGSHGSRLWRESSEQAQAANAMPDGAEYTPVHEYVYKLRLVLDTLHTETARQIGRERHAFMQRFYAQLDAEMLGPA